jgi:RimJ/RimL family protein N-acetyltransferase
VTWLNDPEVLAGLSLYLPLSMGEEEQWFQDMLKAPGSEHPLVIETREGDEWVPVGTCGFHQIEWKNRSGELGIFIGEKRCWNKGYGTEVMKLLLQHGFNTLNLHRIFLRVFSNNPRAVRSYEKAGFVHEGCMRQAEYRDGQYVDVLLMSVLRPEWKE